MSCINAYDIISNREVHIYYESLLAFKCPQCDILQRPIFHNSLFANGKLYILCYCENCKHAYIAEYECKFRNNSTENYDLQQFVSAYPNDKKHSSFGDSIQNLSPMFVKVYDQALTANSFGLDEIAGMGFRKAIEFLVKDYAISLFPNEKEKIEKMHLSDTIDKINYQPITDIAKPCIKVLNDETHYFRKFERVEVENINKLILAIVGILSAKFIASEIVVPNSDDSDSSTQQVL